MYIKNQNGVNQQHEFKIRKGPDGIHLFNRQNGLNILLDDAVTPESDWTNSPRQVSIALTNDCDLRCAHCYAPKHRSTLEKSRVKDWLLEMDSMGVFGIGFGGGEPTLHEDLVELCQFGQEETKLSISFTTHGHTLTPQLISQLKSHVNFIRVSMDGTYSNYESIRKRPFKGLLSNLELLKGRIPFGINYVVNSKTIEDLPNALELSKELGADEFLILPEVPVGFGKKIDDVTLSKLKEIVGSRSSTIKSMRVSISSDYKNQFVTAIGLQKESCLQGFAHIDASGVLKLSSFDKNGVPIGGGSLTNAYRQLTNTIRVELE